MRCPNEIDSLILEQLAGGDKGHLRLVVALRRRLGGFEKRDLSETVKSAVHKLIVSETIVDDDGIYSLAKQR